MANLIVYLSIDNILHYIMDQDLVVAPRAEKYVLSSPLLSQRLENYGGVPNFSYIQ